MNTKRLQLASIILLIGSLLVELSESQAWLAYAKKEVAMGISLGLILFSLSFNVKIIRTLGLPKPAKKRSQLFVLISTVYVLLAYAMDLF
ncbi:hypothetical protein [Roseivirga pacifica]|uniref:hypothetical protein n=1 Tax=Roseivirga pacifica TaxID=1267423 RepID=UPI00209444EC|nr:hypothetical protein [Roseivirga pacifica]MCO6358725.1 hypothetical protein [Roseivirga pacifica]MCO6365639.1 hypothetical protein [Roseivirga pacifica]MCO6371631.1 hypothetical protein [Roseivirga pacifica]MCO6376258.1 hypothetical protein [Roseivirga pacifica]MCO6379009.1 hypothetical protein [Roseivirga pacifica]